MNTYFLDSSAVVRLYVVEPGERVVRSFVRSATAEPPTAEVAVCDLAYPEAVSALHRIVRGNDARRRGLSPAALRSILPRVEADLTRGSEFFILPASDCMSIAAGVASRQTIRGADAVQLAAAILLRNSLVPGSRLLFVSDDAAQVRAAAEEGLEVFRPAA